MNVPVLLNLFIKLGKGLQASLAFYIVFATSIINTKYMSIYVR